MTSKPQHYTSIDMAWLSNTLNIPIEHIKLERVADKTFSRVYTLKLLGKTYYVKQNPSSFVQEGALIKYLCTITHDNNLPMCIDHDSNTNTFVMRAIDKSLANAYAILNVVSAYLNLQLNTDTSILTQYNCRSLDTEHLYDHTKSALVRMLPVLSSVNSLKVEVLLKSMYKIRPVFDKLKNAHIPDTLEHTDFHLGNILSRMEQPVFIDFAESAIACPLFSFISFKDSITKRYKLAIDDVVLDKLTTTYIRLMSTLLDMPKMRIASTLSDAKMVYPWYYLLTMLNVLQIHHDETGKAYQSARLSNTIDALFHTFA